MDPLIAIAFCPFCIFISINVPLDLQPIPHNTTRIANTYIYSLSFRPTSTFFIRFEFKKTSDDFTHNNGLGICPRINSSRINSKSIQEIVDWEKGQAACSVPYRNKVEPDYVMRPDSICFYSQPKCRQNLFPPFTWPARIELLGCIPSAKKDQINIVVK